MWEGRGRRRVKLEAETERKDIGAADVKAKVKEKGEEGIIWGCGEKKWKG